jgi:hypothetical protein
MKGAGFFSWLFGYWELEIAFSDATEFMNICQRYGFVYRGFAHDRERDSASFTCASSTAKQLMAACRARGVEIRVISKRGAPYLIYKYRARAGLFVGLLISILIFALSLPISSFLDGYVCILGLINLATAISNLIPVEGYDGYGILKQILSAKNMIGGIRTLDRVSFVFSVLATFLSLYLIDKADSGYWIFAVFFVMMISKLGKYERYGVE